MNNVHYGAINECIGCVFYYVLFVLSSLHMLYGMCNRYVVIVSNRCVDWIFSIIVCLYWHVFMAFVIIVRILIIFVDFVADGSKYCSPYC